MTGVWCSYRRREATTFRDLHLPGCFRASFLPFLFCTSPSILVLSNPTTGNAGPVTPHLGGGSFAPDFKASEVLQRRDYSGGHEQLIFKGTLTQSHSERTERNEVTKLEYQNEVTDYNDARFRGTAVPLCSFVATSTKTARSATN